MPKPLRIDRTHIHSARLQALEVRRRAWERFERALGDDTPISLLRAYMNDWIRTDNTVKRLSGQMLTVEDVTDEH